MEIITMNGVAMTMDTNTGRIVDEAGATPSNIRMIDQEGNILDIEMDLRDLPEGTQIIVNAMTKNGLTSDLAEAAPELGFREATHHEINFTIVEGKFLIISAIDMDNKVELSKGDTLTIAVDGKSNQVVVGKGVVIIDGKSYTSDIVSTMVIK